MSADEKLDGFMQRHDVDAFVRKYSRLQELACFMGAEDFRNECVDEATAREALGGAFGDEYVHGVVRAKEGEAQ